MRHEKIQPEATRAHPNPRARAARPQPAGRIEQLQRLAGNAAVTAALLTGDDRLAVQRGKEGEDDGGSGGVSAPSPSSPPPRLGDTGRLRGLDSDPDLAVGGGAGPRTSALRQPGPPRPKRSVNVGDALHEDSPTYTEEEGARVSVHGPGDRADDWDYPTTRGKPAESGEPKAYRRGRQQLSDEARARSNEALARAFEDGKDSVVFGYRGRGLAATRHQGQYIGYSFTGWIGSRVAEDPRDAEYQPESAVKGDANQEVYSLVSGLESGSLDAQSAIRQGDVWYTLKEKADADESEATLAGAVEPLEWAPPEASTEWVMNWDDGRAPLGERDLAIIRQVVDPLVVGAEEADIQEQIRKKRRKIEADPKFSTFGLENYSLPALYRLRDLVAQYLEVNGSAGGPTNAKARALAQQLLQAHTAEKSTYRTYWDDRGRAVGNPFKGDSDDGQYLVAAWMRRSKRPIAPATLPQHLAHNKPKATAKTWLGRAAGFLGIGGAIGGAAWAGAKFASAVADATSQSWLTPLYGGLIAGGVAALVAGIGYAIYRRRRKPPSAAPLDYAAQIAQANADADAQRTALAETRTRLAGGPVNARDRATYVATQDATEAAGAVERAYRRPAEDEDGVQPSVEELVSVLVDQPAGSVSADDAMVYGPALHHLLAQGVHLVPVRPADEPTSDQFHGGDPGAGDMWERRVEAQAINKRTEMAREIARQFGLDPAHVEGEQDVVDFLNRRAGRQAPARAPMG